MSPQRNKRRATPEVSPSLSQPERDLLAFQLDVLGAIESQYEARGPDSSKREHSVALDVQSDLTVRTLVRSFVSDLSRSAKGAVTLALSSAAGTQSLVLPAFRTRGNKDSKAAAWFVRVVQPILAVARSGRPFRGSCADPTAAGASSSSPLSARQSTLQQAFNAAAPPGSPAKKAKSVSHLVGVRPWYLQEEYASGTAKLVHFRNRGFSTLGITGSHGISGTLTMGSWRPVLDALQELDCPPGADLLELGAGVGQSAFAYMAAMETLRGQLPKEVLAIELCPDRTMVLQRNWRAVTQTKGLEHWGESCHFMAYEGDLSTFDFARRKPGDGAGSYGSPGAVCFSFDKGIPFDDRQVIYDGLLHAKWGFLVCNSSPEDFADQNIPVEHHKSVVMSQFGSGQSHTFNVYRRVQ